MKNIADIKDEYRDSITGGGNEAWLKEMYDTQQKQLSSYNTYFCASSLE